MTIAYWCVLVAAFLPYVWVTVAKASGQRYDNREPRAWQAQQDNPRSNRANAAQMNAFEAFAPFAASVLMAQVAGVDPARISVLAIAFVLLRVLHGVFYVAGGRRNPRDIKLRLARELAARFHGEGAADNAVAGWNAAVRGEGDTASLPLTDVTVPAEGLRIAALLVAAGLMPSNSEASRKLKERAVRIDNVVVEDPQQVFMPGFEGVLAVGRRNFARVRLVAA